MNWWSKCARYRQDLSLLAMDALDAAERVAIERHLARCARCRTHYEELRSVAQSLASLRESVADVEPTASMEQNWARAIHHSDSGQRGRLNEKMPLARLWRELILPYRRGWGAIGVLWLAMWLVNWGQPQVHKPAGTESVKTSAMAMNFVEERRLLAELIQPAETEPAEPPRPKPAPHSERRRMWVIV